MLTERLTSIVARLSPYRRAGGQFGLAGKR